MSLEMTSWTQWNAHHYDYNIDSWCTMEFSPQHRNLLSIRISLHRSQSQHIRKNKTCEGVLLKVWSLIKPLIGNIFKHWRDYNLLKYILHVLMCMWKHFLKSPHTHNDIDHCCCFMLILGILLYTYYEEKTRLLLKIEIIQNTEKVICSL